jgi:hypothetical protein
MAGPDRPALAGAIGQPRLVRRDPPGRLPNPRPGAAWTPQQGTGASAPSQGSSQGASGISYSTVPCSRRTTSALALRSNAATTLLSAEARAVKAADAFGAGAAGQLGQQLGAQPAALPVVDDGDGDLGGVRVVGVADVTGDTDAAPAGVLQRAERLVVVVVDIGKVAQLG